MKSKNPFKDFESFYIGKVKIHIILQVHRDAAILQSVPYNNINSVAILLGSKNWFRQERA